jgi:hypothetical protein
VVYPPGAPPAHGRAAIHAFFVKDNADFLRGGLIFSLGAKPDGGVTGYMGRSSGTYAVKDKTGHVVDTGLIFAVRGSQPHRHAITHRIGVWKLSGGDAISNSACSDVALERRDMC